MSLTVKSYVSDGSVLLAFDMPQPASDFAGFAIQCIPKGAQPYYLQNRLNFTQGVHAETPAGATPWTTSDQAPFQKFYWMHFPPSVDQIKQYDYEITAMYFQSGQGLKKGDSGRVSVDFDQFGDEYKNFTPGFTRGYLSSQAYATKFGNKPIRPAKKSMDFDTKPFAEQWAWLGYSARKLVFDFLNECLQDKSIHVDLFAYDLDEPDFIQGMIQLGKEGRLRAFLDDAKLHTKTGAIEIDAHKALLAAAGADNVVQGHFKRFAHCKVMIARRNGKDGPAFKVFCGSANFSIRGLYVQANNCIVINDPKTADGYGQAFDEAFTQQQQLKNSAKTATAFAKSPIAARYFDYSAAGLPKFQIAYSPHSSDTVSLNAVAQAIKNAKTSVIFAVMQLGGGGDVMTELNNLAQRSGIFAYGMTQAAGHVKLFSPGSAQHGVFAAFDYLKSKVPPPFDVEYSGGSGIVIHNKFVVVDFNGDNPVVFTGSSNLAGGGEEQNGDSLLAISDPAVAVGYAVEGIRLVDHYHFRMMESQHPSTDPITLQGAGSQASSWWQPYYDPKNNKYTERVLFSQGHQAVVKAHAAAAGAAVQTSRAPISTGPITTTGKSSAAPAAQPPADAQGGASPKHKKAATPVKAKVSRKSGGSKKKSSSRKKSGTHKKAATRPRTVAKKARAGKKSSSKKRSRARKPTKRTKKK